MLVVRIGLNKRSNELSPCKRRLLSDFAGLPTVISTLERGVGSYVDYQYYFIDNHLHKYLEYDVRPYFQPSSAYADPNWKFAGYGNTYPGGMNGGEKEAMITKEQPLTYRLNGFPNPFNPSTRLHFELKDDSHVRLIVYDVRGRNVAELTNMAYKAGVYDIQWNANDVLSGVYFAVLIVSPPNEKPLALTQKLLLVK